MPYGSLASYYIIVTVSECLLDGDIYVLSVAHAQCQERYISALVTTEHSAVCYLSLIHI